MEAINEQELNKELAEFAEFQWLKATDESYYWFDKNSDIVSPTDEKGNVIWDMNACFEHLVPKCIDKIMAGQECSSDVAYSILFKKWLQELELNMTRPALTLCLAISKMIKQRRIKGIGLSNKI